MRVFLGAFGDPGHAFPVIALGTRLRARGHDVTIETWGRWRDQVERAGIRFVPAPEYPVFPTRERPLQPYEAVLAATPVTRRAIAEAAPDVVVHDVLTLAPALAAELERVPVATLIPHPYPVPNPGLAPYAIGARPPRTPAGRALWRGMDALVKRGLERGRDELNETRRRLGLAPRQRLYSGISPRLCIVGTFPQLEYPREWPESVHVVGPLLWEPPAAEVEPPPGAAPLVLVATSTAQDPEHQMLRACVTGLAREPVRVLATYNRRPLIAPLRVPANARLVDWLSYSRTMPHCDLVVCHAGHGTLARSLASGAPVVSVPHSGDMGENAARADWAGVGVRLPWRLLSPATLRLAVRRGLRDSRLRSRSQELAAWASANDGATRAAELVEGLV
ncbi:MAG TPA: nucleotide disphospho-sugar-binding domain-containing protein [Solirubrobacteraceae bacterium]|nr:nucleotide disphospho-sugar-binding domain-containing protein [Solirubrobacteraceae bacterium]